MSIAKVKFRKPTEDEKWDYWNQTGEDRPLYPLAYIADVDGITVMVEDLREYESGNKYDAVAPDGYKFCGDMSSLVCIDYNDLRERLKYNELEKVELN